MSKLDKLSVLFSFKNEERNIRKLVKRTTDVCNICLQKSLISEYEIIFVDDASDDRSNVILNELRADHPNIQIHKTTRSFGNSECLRYAINVSSGDIICYLDADLQDPPELIFDLIKEHQTHDVDVVYTKRLSRKGESRIKLFITWLGYKFLSSISSYPLLRNVGDFTLINRKVADQLKNSPEQLPYTRGIVQYFGYPYRVFEYHRDPRNDGADNSKFPIFKLKVWYGYFDRALLSTTDLPLKIFFPISLILFSFSFLIIVHVILQVLSNTAPPGWSSIILITLILASINFLALGAISLYINNIYLTLRGRPDIIIRNIDK